MRLFFTTLFFVATNQAAAHEGHGNTVIHALAHFFEGHGPLIWAAVIIAVIGIASHLHRRGQKK